MWSQGKPLNQKIKGAFKAGSNTFGDLRSDLETWRLDPENRTDRLSTIHSRLGLMGEGEYERAMTYTMDLVRRTPLSVSEVRHAIFADLTWKPNYVTCTTMSKKHNPIWYMYHIGKIPRVIQRKIGRSFKISEQAYHQAAANAARESFVSVSEKLEAQYPEHFKVLRESFPISQDWTWQDRVNFILFESRSFWGRAYKGYDPQLRLSRSRKSLRESVGTFQLYQVGPIAGPRNQVAVVNDELRQLVQALKHFSSADASLAKHASKILRFYDSDMDERLIKHLTEGFKC